MAKRSRKSRGDATITPRPAEVVMGEASSPDNLLKRSETARRLGVSTTTLRRMEGRVLTPEIGPDGVHRFRESHVRELVMQRETAPSPERYDGAMAAQVFELLDQGVHPVDVVKQLALDPRAVEAIHEQWASMRGAFVVTGEVARRIEAIPWIFGMRPMRTGKDLLFNLEAVDSRICERCHDAVATLCAQCVRVMKASETYERAVAMRIRRDERHSRHVDTQWAQDFADQIPMWSKEPAVAVRPGPSGRPVDPAPKPPPGAPTDPAVPMPSESANQAPGDTPAAPTHSEVPPERRPATPDGESRSR